MATVLDSFRRSLIGHKIKTSKSDRSESVYIDHGGLHIRVSHHYLGRSDYGSVEQVHRGGPNVVIDRNNAPTPAHVAAYVLEDVRNWVDCDGWKWPKVHRSQVAGLIRVLRKMA